MSGNLGNAPAEKPLEGEDTRHDRPLPSGPADPGDPLEISVHTFKLQGVDDLREIGRGADVEIVQLAPGRLEGQLMHAQIGGLAVNAGDFSLDIRARGVMNPRLVHIGMLLDKTVEVSQWRYDMVPGDIIVFPKGAEQDGHGRGRYSFGSIVLSEEALAAFTAIEPALQDSEFWTKPHRFRPSPSLRAFACREIAEKVSHLREGVVPVSAAGIRYFQRSLIEAFITGIADEVSNRRVERHRHGAKLLRDVEDYVAGIGLDRPVHISELCSALMVSRRTLHRAFEETLGMGPMAYLRLKRLTAVHRALSTETSAGTSVTQTALNYGFADLGRFAAYYKGMFGEFPSQTRHEGEPSA